MVIGKPIPIPPLITMVITYLLSWLGGFWITELRSTEEPILARESKSATSATDFLACDKPLLDLGELLINVFSLQSLTRKSTLWRLVKLESCW